MRVAVVGVGGVGGILAASLASAGRASVKLVAHGLGLGMLQRYGLTVRTFEGETHHFHFDPHAVVSVEDTALRGEAVDVVFITTKAHQISSTLDALVRLIGPDTIVVPCTNGLPWWFFHPAVRPKGRDTGIRLFSTDPTGRLAREIHFQRILGCVGMISGHAQPNYRAWHSSWPSEKNVLLLGEPNGCVERSGRAEAVRSLFDGARVPVSVQVVDDIRSEIFDKLLINASINPIAALARADCGQIVDSHAGPELLRDIVEEVTAVAHALDPPVRVTKNADDILDMYRGHYGLRASMLQDADGGRSIEKDSIVGALVELGAHVGVPVPSLKIVSHLLDVMEAAASQRAGFGAFYELSSVDLPDRIRNMNYEIAP